MTTRVLGRCSMAAYAAPIIHHRATNVDGVNALYREAGLRMSRPCCSCTAFPRRRSCSAGQGGEDMKDRLYPNIDRRDLLRAMAVGAAAATTGACTSVDAENFPDKSRARYRANSPRFKPSIASTATRRSEGRPSCCSRGHNMKLAVLRWLQRSRSKQAAVLTVAAFCAARVSRPAALPPSALCRSAPSARPRPARRRLPARRWRLGRTSARTAPSAARSSPRSPTACGPVRSRDGTARSTAARTAARARPCETMC